MEVQVLYCMLRRVQEPKGYYFNIDRKKTFELLEGLLVNNDRLGYMCCPNRPASGDREWDNDIICPCIYREPDVDKYGSCYCHLYVSKEWNEKKVPHLDVPERRPQDKLPGWLKPDLRESAALEHP